MPTPPPAKLIWAAMFPELERAMEPLGMLLYSAPKFCCQSNVSVGFKQPLPETHVAISAFATVAPLKVSAVSTNAADSALREETPLRGIESNSFLRVFR